ncbi:hypothetical protein C8R45DRAFT_928132 [Mycena sanguinolenta]|nr:hypothetical protein C8R45DRAFT_928132 [Mycena sanguinolenta]
MAPVPLVVEGAVQLLAQVGAVSSQRAVLLPPVVLQAGLPHPPPLPQPPLLPRSPLMEGVLPLMVEEIGEEGLLETTSSPASAINDNFHLLRSESVAVGQGGAKLEGRISASTSTMSSTAIRKIAPKPARSKGLKAAEPKKKVGNPGRFKGAQLEFLESQVPIYLAQKRGDVTDYYKKFFPLWWAKFPWYQGYDRDGQPLPEGRAELGTTVSGSTGNTDGDAPSDVPPDAPPMSGSTGAAGLDGGATSAVPNAEGGHAVAAKEVGESVVEFTATGGVNLACQTRIEDELVAQEKYAELVEQRFKEKWDESGQEAKFALDFCCKCAKELLELEDEAVRAELSTALDVEHAKAMAEHHRRIDAISNPDAPSEAKQEACRQSLAQVAQPFLDSISKLTSLHMVLLAGEGPLQGSERFTLTT